MTIQNPPHPGDFIRTEIIEALDLNVTAAAKIIGVARSTLSNLLNEHANLTPEMGFLYLAGAFQDYDLVLEPIP